MEVPLFIVQEIIFPKILLLANLIVIINYNKLL